MAFDKDTGASAGKKSKRGSSKQINEVCLLTIFFFGSHYKL